MVRMRTLSEMEANGARVHHLNVHTFGSPYSDGVCNTRKHVLGASSDADTPGLARPAMTRHAERHGIKHDVRTG